MRNMSFLLTIPQVRTGTKTVTRRLGWDFLKPGDRLMACEKVRGRRKGEPLVRIREIEVVNKRRERLETIVANRAYGRREVVLEGFPKMKPWEFLAFFIESHKGCTHFTVITRIEFRYVS